jgi:hypothetical protein
VTGPVEDSQDEPLDPETYKHHLLILKSAHCCRPVVHRGLNQFINGLTLHRNGGGNAMTVYLAGMKDGIDSKDIQIPPASPGLSHSGTEPIPD